MSAAADEGARRRFDLGCTLGYTVAEPSTFILNVAAAETAHQRVLEEEMSLSPSLEPEAHTVAHNGNRYHRFKAPAGKLWVSYRARVEVTPRLVAEPGRIRETPVERLPLGSLTYMFPSRYCQSDLLIRLAHQEFGQLAPGYRRIEAICAWIHDNVEYLSGSSDSQTSAFDTASRRAGVCRDFAHLAIALCRALNIPARFVSAYAWRLEPPDFHAVFEAYLGGRWYLFDATRRAPVESLVRIGSGHDAAEVSFASIIGAAAMTWMEVFSEPIDTPAGEPPRPAAADGPVAVTTAAG